MRDVLLTVLRTLTIATSILTIGLALGLLIDQLRK